MTKKPVMTGPWHKGIDSQSNPSFLGNDQVAWSTNMINRGGAYQTRPSYVRLTDSDAQDEFARGFTVFTPLGGLPHLVKASGTQIRVSPYPFTSWSVIQGLTLDEGDGMVHFEECVRGAQTNEDGTITVLNPYPILIIQTGQTRAAFWDGVDAGFLDPNEDETPIGTWMQWIGSRLWIAQGKRLRVSNILDPLSFTEEDIPSEGGFLTLPGDCTGLAITADSESLLAFTDVTTTAFRASILQRAPDPITGAGGWGTIQDFQRVILPTLGCIAGHTITNQYGVTWWMAQGGWIGLDGALQTYRTSRIAYKDNEMSRSKSNLFDDVSRSCAGTFENFLMVSVPSGDIFNAHTWVMDQGVLQGLSAEAGPAWASNWIGTRPVQWVTANVQGKSRCFFYSYDYRTSGGDWSTNIWEAFCPVTKDIAFTGLSGKRVDWTLETKFMNDSSLELKEFDHFKFQVEEAARVVDFEGFYASKHSGYRQVLDKIIVSTIDSMSTDAEETTEVKTYLRQSREIKSTGDEHVSTNLDGGAESQYNRNIDYGFSILLKGTGVVSIPWIILYYKQYVEQMDGRVEEDEETQRYITAAGGSVITDDAAVVPNISGNRQSAFIRPVHSRYMEASYSSV